MIPVLISLCFGQEKLMMTNSIFGYLECYECCVAMQLTVKKQVVMCNFLLQQLSTSRSFDAPP